MSDSINQIKERLNIVDVISGYLKIQKAGVNFKARCPFHNEKSASFYVSPDRQIWHCFGCQKGGDMFGFIKEIEGVEFVEALRVLAQRAGVKLENYDPSIKDEKAVLYEVCENSSRFFEKQLHHSPDGKKALAYLRNRGLEDSTIKEFRLGFAPEGWHNLSYFLRDCDYKDADVINAGLALKKDDGSDMYDRFRSRIIFPIFDLNSQVVGFTGRVFSVEGTPSGHEESAKYINTPQTAIYDKSRVLYGFNLAKTEARLKDRCLLVEGNIDAIMSYQAGVKNVAATSGTALTPSHLQLLQRYTNNLDFSFDTDQAGLIATRRGIGLALSQNFNIKIVHLQDQECKDPADYVQKYGQKWQDVVASAKPVIDFYFDKFKSELDLSSVDGKKAIVAGLAPFIKRLTSNVERIHWITRLATALRTREEAIEADISAAKDDLDTYANNRPEEPVRKIQPVAPEDINGEALLAALIKNPALFNEDLKTLDLEIFTPVIASIIAELKKTEPEKFSFATFAKKFQEQEAMRLEVAYLRSQELLKDFDDTQLRSEFINARNKMRAIYIKAKLAVIQMEIKEADASKNTARLAVLLPEANELNKTLFDIQKNNS